MEAAGFCHDFGSATEFGLRCSTKMVTGKRKKTQATKSKPEKTDWVKDVLGEWAEAAGKNDCDPMGLNDAPEWVLNAWVECCKIVFPGGLPSVEKWDAKFLGEFLGRFYGLENLYAGAVPLGPETRTEKDKIEAIAKNKPVKIPRGFEKDIITKFKATHEAIPLATAAATSASYDEGLKFQKGLARGMEIKPDELATSRTFERHTRTFFVLALQWRRFSQCRSVGEIHRILCKEIGEAKIGSLKTFETHVAKKIGLKVRGRGRPKAAK
jgi:hypothetical protein